MKKYKISDVLNKVQKLTEICQRIPSLEGNHKKDFTKALKCLKKIVDKSDANILKALPDLNDLLHSCVILLQSSYAQCNFQYAKHSSKRPIVKTRKHFCLLLSSIFPEKMPEVVDIIMCFIRSENLWNREGICCEAFSCLLSCHAPCEMILEKILDHTEEMIIANNIDDARCSVRVLHTIVDEKFKELPASGLIRLLSLYHLNVDVHGMQKKLYCLKTGFKITLEKIFKVMDVQEIDKLMPTILSFTFENDLSSVISLEQYGMTMLKGVSRLVENKIEDNFHSDTTAFLLSAMTLNCEVKSYLACRFLTLIFDVRSNAKEFSSLNIFYPEVTYKFKVNYNEMNEIFHGWELIEESLLTAIKLHGCKIKNLEAIHSFICVLLTTIPIPFINVLIIGVLFELQIYTVSEKHNLDQNFINYSNALVISVMSLIAYTTNEDAFSKYIKKIIIARYQVAPHFNPPLKEIYTYADHHVLSFKSNLMLDQWELRYCLWKPYCLNLMEERYPNAKFFKLFKK